MFRGSLEEGQGSAGRGPVWWQRTREKEFELPLALGPLMLCFEDTSLCFPWQFAPPRTLEVGDGRVG